MKFDIKNNSGENLNNLMRKIGYFFHQESGSELSFTRPFDRSGYPRFHLYVKADSDNRTIFMNLHLDQKKAIYKGTHAHSGEYEGEILKQEVDRIIKIAEAN